MADTLSELGSGICPYTNKRSNTKYGLQQNINAENRNNALLVYMYTDLSFSFVGVSLPGLTGSD